MAAPYVSCSSHFARFLNVKSLGGKTMLTDKRILMEVVLMRMQDIFGILSISMLSCYAQVKDIKARQTLKQHRNEWGFFLNKHGLKTPFVIHRTLLFSFLVTGLILKAQ